MVKIDCSEWDKPLDKTINCVLCHSPLKVTYHWIVNHWLHATVHDQCAANFEKRLKGKKALITEIPERFQHWDSAQFSNQQAVADASSFDLNAAYTVLALVGLPGRGKSRLMWHVVSQFFSDLPGKWVDYFLFVDLMSGEYDQSRIIKIKTSPFVFIDDIGCTESYGRTRAQLQDAIRYRVQMRRWTFLTIDDPSFDNGLIENVFRDRAVVVIFDE
jgi:DNA replication protein DnaC